MITVEQLSFWYPGATTAPCRRRLARARRGDVRARRRARPARASRPCCGRSTVWCRTSPAATSKGRVVTGGLDPRTSPPRELAGTVGVVGQDPLAGFVTDTVEEELAYGMEQLAVPPQVMRRRVEEVLDLMGIAPLRRRALRTLSGGEQQRVAIAAALVTSTRRSSCSTSRRRRSTRRPPRTRSRRSSGWSTTSASRCSRPSIGWSGSWSTPTGWSWSRAARVATGLRPTMLREAPLAPPVVELGRLAGWDPLPLSVRDARRRVGPLRDRLAPRRARPSAVPRRQPGRSRTGRGSTRAGSCVRYGAREVVREVDLSAGARRDRGADGPQRLRQVVVAVGDPGRRPDGRPGASASAAGRRGPRRAATRGSWWRWSRSRRPTCSIHATIEAECAGR